MNILRIVLTYLAFILVIAIPPFVLAQTGNQDLITPHFWLIFFFLSALTFIVVILILIIQKNNSELYAQAFLGGTTFKILACMFFVLIFLHKNHVDRLVFVADFFYVYFLNTAFEVYTLLRKLRNQNLR